MHLLLNALLANMWPIALRGCGKKAARRVVSSKGGEQGWKPEPHKQCLTETPWWPGGTKASVFDLKAITRLLLLPTVLPVFLVKVISGFPSGESYSPSPTHVCGLR